METRKNDKIGRDIQLIYLQFLLPGGSLLKNNIFLTGMLLFVRPSTGKSMQIPHIEPFSH